jgi:phospholipid:diacylglycerol acyltransferase
MKRVDELYSYGISHDLSDPKYSTDQRYWANPLETTLPQAPNMKIYCLYGVGKDTERAYYYEQNREQCVGIPVSINTKMYNKESKVSFGVQLVEGDGTVPLMSLGYMCVKGWKDVRYLQLYTNDCYSLFIILPMSKSSQESIIILFNRC